MGIKSYHKSKLDKVVGFFFKNAKSYASIWCFHDSILKKKKKREKGENTNIKNWKEVG